MGNIGATELLVILLIVVVLFGATKLPALGKGLGEAIKNFKQGVRDGEAPPPPSDASQDKKA